MIPYTDFLYFGISLYALLPNFLFGWWKHTFKVWIVIATGLMLVIQYFVVKVPFPNTTLLELWLVLGYGVLQYLVAGSFLLIRKRGTNRVIFYLALFLSLAPLLAAKFIPLVQTSYQLVFIGLSYVTFRCLDVIIGIHEGLIQSLPPIQYLTFLLFFPTISSGPIDRYKRFAEDWNQERSWKAFLKDLDGAVHHIFTGFLYKFILAALIKTYWLDVVAPLPGLPSPFPTCMPTACTCSLISPDTALLRLASAACLAFTPRRISTGLSWHITSSTSGIAGTSAFPAYSAIMFTAALSLQPSKDAGSRINTPPPIWDSSFRWA
jgi:hypothetical protein